MLMMALMGRAADLHGNILQTDILGNISSGSCRCAIISDGQVRDQIVAIANSQGLGNKCAMLLLRATARGLRVAKSFAHCWAAAPDQKGPRMHCLWGNSAGPTRGRDCWGLGAVSGLLKLQTSTPLGCQPLARPTVANVLTMTLTLTPVLFVDFARTKRGQMTRSAGKSAYQGKPHISAPVRPRMQVAGLQCIKLQTAVASPDPQTRAFPGMQISWKTRSHNHRCAMVSQKSQPFQHVS